MEIPTPPKLRIRLGVGQSMLFKSDRVENFAICGRGWGKSFMLGLLAYTRASVPGSVGLLAAPTNDQLRNSTLRQVLNECWEEKLGIIEGVHYTINEQPDPRWGVPAFSKLQNTKIITFAHGSYIVVDSLENFNKHRGAAYDYMLVDEFREVDTDVRKVLLGCRRGKVYKRLGRMIQIFYVTTPPEDPTLTMELRDNIPPEKCLWVGGSSHHNEQNLPDGYIEDMESVLDPDSVQREVYGQLVNSNNKPFVSAFDREKHVSAMAEWQEDKPLYIWMDFNLGIMATLVVQFGKDWIKVIDEFPPAPNIDIEDRCETILSSRYGGHIRKMIITGDPAKGSTGVNKNVDYYIRIKALLRLRDEQIKVRPSHMFIKDSRVLLNSLFARFPRLLIHPRCKKLIYDLTYCRVDDKGELDKKSNPNLTHYVDALRYGFEIHWWHWLKSKLPEAKKKIAALVHA